MRMLDSVFSESNWLFCVGHLDLDLLLLGVLGADPPAHDLRLVELHTSVDLHLLSEGL